MCCTNKRRAVSLAPFRLLNRCLLTVTALVAIAALAPAPLIAQTATTGTVRGRVQNASNGEYVKNVTVTVKGTDLKTYTDEFGEYELSNVPTGEVTVNADYVGEPTQTSSVTVTPGQGVSQDFTFRQGAVAKLDKNGTVVLDPFVVSAERYKNAMAIAIAEERNSVNMKNVVSAEAFGDIPSGNVGEFVKFLPGVQISYGSYAQAPAGASESIASGISVRGFGPEDTAILIDGLPVSNASPGSLTRQVGLDMLSITNASRVELVKVATPDMPANSIGGQVNLISKNSFEFAKPSYTARVYFNFNSLGGLSLSKSDGPVNKQTYKTTPGVDLSVSYPFTKNFGITVSAHASRTFDLNYRAQPTWSYDKTASNFSNTISGVKVYTRNSQGDLDITNPMLTRFQITDNPRMVDQKSSNIRMDWRPTPAQTLSVNVQYSDYADVNAQRRMDFNVNHTPAASSATYADFGPGFSNSAVEASATSTNRGRSKADMTVTTIDTVGSTKTGQLNYRFQRGGWNVAVAGSYSQSNGRYVDHANGHYSGMDMSSSPGRVDFADIQDSIPGTIVTYATNKNGGRPFDYTQLSNWQISGLKAQSAESYSRNTIGLYKLDVDRALDFLPFLGTNSLDFKIGARRDQEKTEKWGFGTGYRDVYVGPGLTATDVLDPANYRSPGYGQPAQQWASTYTLYELNQANQIFYEPTVALNEAEAINNYYSYVGQQKSLTETTDAGYAMLSGRFFHDRLSFVGGLRKERKSRVGYGPRFDNGTWMYAKNADGTLYRDSVYPNGVKFDNGTFLTDSALRSRLSAAGITAPDHVLNKSTLEAAKLMRIANSRVDDSNSAKPSLSLNTSFAVTKKIDFKAAWSRSFGLPDLENGSNGVLSGNGAFSITENATIPADGTLGTIKVANPGLPPSVSDNWDFQVAYYTDKGGKFAVSYYLKSVTNQPQTFSMYSDNPSFGILLNALGLEQDGYQDYKIDTSSVSATVQKTHGWEFEARQDLGILGEWGRHFQMFASYTLKSLGTPSAPVPYTITTPQGVELQLVPTVKTINLTANRFASAGLQFSSKRFTAQIRGTYRNDNEQNGNRALVKGSVDNFLRRIEPAETRIDVNATYMLSKTYSLFVSGRDVFNGSRNLVIRDDYGLLPTYAQTFEKKQFGVTWTMGVNGKW